MNLVNKIEPIQANRVVINWAIGLVLARCILLILFQGILSFYFHLQGNQTPWESAAKWWSVYGNLADISCLILLTFALKKEGKNLTSLLDFDKNKIFQDLKFGLIIFLIIFPLIGLGYTFVTGYLILNQNTLNLTIDQLSERTLPSWAYYYSIFFWWTIWSITEEVTYQSYGLKRLIGKYGQVKTLLFVGFFFALQHSFLPLIFDWRYIIWRFIAFFPLVLGLMIAYMKTGRITPVIIAHALMDINAAYWTFKH
jgi:membrane protease YdiL (CAAX protease family)